MPVPQPGETVTAWMWPSDFQDLQREGSSLRTATLEKEPRAQFLIPVQLVVVQPEAKEDPPLQFPERKQQNPDDTPLQKARKRYHAIWGELIEHTWERDDYRHAFHAAHKDLPDDERFFGLPHYQLAIQELETPGMLLVTKAVELAREKDPADAADVEALTELLEGCNPESNRTKRGWWVIQAGVGEWVREALAYQQAQAA